MTPRNSKILSSIILLITTLSVVGQVNAKNGYFDCPISPTEFQVPIPVADPAPEPGEFPADLDEIMAYVLENNISSVKELLDHSPSHLRKNFAFVAKTRGLGETSVDEPGLLLFGSDGRFMMNINTIPSSPRYEVVDIAYLDEEGDWEFKSLDFRASPPTLSPNGGNNNECRECHGQGGVSSKGPMKPFWGNYLDWPGFFSDNGQNKEKVTAEQASTLQRIEKGIQNPDRFHSIIIPPRFYRVGGNISLPNHQYGISLTVANNEIGSAATESIYKRAKRSPLYKDLREEYLTLAYCAPAGEVSQEDRIKLTQLIEKLGGSTAAISRNIYRGWIDIVRLWGLDPLHEFPLHKLSTEYATTTLADTRWNASSGRLPEQLSLLVLLDLAEDNSQIDSILRNNQTSYEMTACGILFNNQKEYLQHKVYANYTLKGNARQLARSSYYDIDYSRFSQSMDYVKTELCDLLTSDIGAKSSLPASLPKPVKPTPTTETPQHIKKIENACQKGQRPVDFGELIEGNAVCLKDLEGGEQTQMHFYVTKDKVGHSYEIILSHGVGNGDLFHKHDSRPTGSVYDAISKNPTNEERILVKKAKPNWNYIHVRTEVGFSGATLLVRYLPENQ